MTVAMTHQAMINHLSRNGLLSDIQIRHLAHHHEMISPFVEREKHSRIIPYGVTSYGYEARLAPTYEVFTHHPTTIIDPKQFDEQEYIEYHSESHLIPPNGFVLGHTMESFKIPQDVLTMSSGHSSLTRCFSGDTQIAMADGTYKSFLELIDLDAQGQDLYGLSYDHTNQSFMTAQIQSPRKIGTETLYEMIFSDESKIWVTPDHQFLIENDDGSVSTLPAKDLRPYHSLVQFSYQTPVKITVASVVPLVGMHDVYCLTVPDYGNFVLGCGPAVLNCGLNVTVTPLEPGWVGVVDVTLHNTTNRTMRFYPNEGVASFVFLRGSMPCENR